MLAILLNLVLLFVALPDVRGHIALWHKSMWGFNVTDKTFPYDNRPVVPLMNMTFDQWWFHNHLQYPPHDGDFFDLPAGKPATTELACNKGATSFFASSEGGDDRKPNDPDNPCPGADISEFHTTGPNDLFGCALAITYKSDVNQVQPQDFTVFSVNQTCVWTRFTDFQVPAKMPPCPPGGCICAWFWIHSPDSGGEQNYMNGFRCNITGSTSNVALATPQVPRRCGKDPANGKMQDFPGNCTYGAKQPFYWFQQDNNNMFEGTYSPPRYLDMYNFRDGAQDDIFVDSYPGGIPPPSPNTTVIPSAFLGSPAPAQTAPPSSPASGGTLSSSGSAAVSQTSASTSLASPSAASATSLLSSSPPSASPPASPSVSVSVSVVTVVSTAVVTATVPAASVVSDSLAPTPTGPSTSTITSTVVVIVSDADAASAAETSPSLAVTITSTVYAIATSTPQESAAPVIAAVASNDTTRVADFAQLERVLGNSTTFVSNTSQPSDPSPTLDSDETVKKCNAKRSMPSDLQRRSRSFLSSIPGVRSHRRLSKKSSLWNIF